MDNITEYPDIPKHADGQPIYVATMSLLDAIAEHVEEAGLGELHLYLRAAELELSQGPWRPAPTIAAERTTITEEIGLLLALLEELRQQVNDEVARVALAATRLWVVDGIDHLDGLAAEIARSPAEANAVSGRVDLVWRTAS